MITKVFSSFMPLKKIVKLVEKILFNEVYLKRKDYRVAKISYVIDLTWSQAK